MNKFIKINNYYIGALINKKYHFMQIETLGEIYQLKNENDLINRFNNETSKTKINMCDCLENDFLLYQDEKDLTEVRTQLVNEFKEILKNENKT